MARCLRTDAERINPKAPMSNQSTETQLALLIQWREQVEKDLHEANAAIAALQEERTKALKWGVGTLGAAVLAMGSWMWNFLTSHIK